MLAFLVFALHRGDLNSADLRRYVEDVRAAVDAEPYKGWRDIAAALEGWPRRAASTSLAACASNRPSGFAR